MQLKPLVFTATVLAAVISGCGSADGPSLWSSGIAVSGDDTGDGTECGAFAACCTELEEHPPSDGASCNGSSIPSDETACAIGLAAFQETGSCTDIANPDGTTSTVDAGKDGSTKTGGVQTFATNCAAATACCAELATMPSANAQCTSSIPAGTPDSECEEALDLFHQNGVCEDIAGPVSSASDAGTTDTGTGSGADGGFGDQPGVYACDSIASDGSCSIYPAAEATDAPADCAGDDGMHVAACPTSALLGCCVPPAAVADAETCWYPGPSGQPATAADVMTLCTQEGFSYSATP
jgi:hypothetical protein